MQYITVTKHRISISEVGTFLSEEVRKRESEGYKYKSHETHICDTIARVEKFEYWRDAPAALNTHTVYNYTIIILFQRD